MFLDYAGLKYAVPKFQQLGITMPEDLLTLTEDDFIKCIKLLNDVVEVQNPIHQKSLFELINKVKVVINLQKYRRLTPILILLVKKMMIMMSLIYHQTFSYQKRPQ